MGYIVAINGTDGSGKTTQIELLKKRNLEYIFFPPDISAYRTFPKQKEKEFFEWWFFNSGLDEFCQCIYKGIQLRQQEAIQSGKKLIILDKGIDTFEARIVANFHTRGYSLERIWKTMRETKRKLNLKDEEQLKLLLLTAEKPEQREEIAKKRRIGRNEEKYYEPYYNQYQKNLEKSMQKQIERNRYQIIPANYNKETVQVKILENIIYHYLQQEREKSNEREMESI